MNVVGSEEAFGLGVETVEGVSYVYDSETGETFLEVPLAHFSSLIVTSSSSYAYFQITAKSGEAVLGQRPGASGVVSQNRSKLDSGDYPGIRSFSVHYSDQTGWPTWFYTPLDYTTHRTENEGQKGTLSLRFQLIEDSVFLRGKTGPGFGTETLSPDKAIQNRPPRTPFGDQYTIPNSDFVCDEVGDGYIDFEFELWWDEKVELQRAWDPEWRAISDRGRSVFVNIHTKVKCIAGTTTTTSSVTESSEPVQIGSAESAVGIGQVAALVDRNGDIWWDISLGEGWSEAQFGTFFSMFFAVSFSGPIESGSSSSCQTHDGVVSSYGSRARGEFTPRAFIAPDGSVLLESGVNLEELPPGTESVLVMADSGVWEDEGGAAAVFSKETFEIDVAGFASANPLENSDLVAVCSG